MSEQPELDLEYSTPDSFTITASKGAAFDEEPLRTHTATSVEDAIGLVESLRDFYENREDVTWDGEEVDAAGRLRGLAPGGTVYLIQVLPPFPS